MDNILSDFGKTAAIVCEHIACNFCNILSAYRTEAIYPEDSGWQFFCGKSEDENPDKAKIWLIQEVLTMEPSLASFILEPPGVQIWRTNNNMPWQIRRLEKD